MVNSSISPLLIAEDSDEDFEVLELLMQQMQVKNPIYRCTNGDKVLDFVYQDGEGGLQHNAQRPSVILLDLNLPGTDGREVLEQLKQDESLREIPIVVFTTSSNPKDIEFCYQNGANGYLIKPVDSDELERTVQAFVNYWLQANVPPLEGADGN
ncbi:MULTISPECIES: response regulator [unclassified Leptolyngbya]|uniref:response regulator n=1 Tax=unclassified Leptolyngbya TaxID=2650499 RepID=UPI001683FEB7|nr:MULTISPECIES: response regulator [unclassified Leptolyngbya]MBD1909261.1 response regulator [Leptolyngbya sp. FACHB-8]MBD2154314.1 response regulator [Leptolyngbya sp. FACHB-16]